MHTKRKKVFVIVLLALFLPMMYCELTHTSPVKVPDSTETK